MNEKNMKREYFEEANTKSTEVYNSKFYFYQEMTKDKIRNSIFIDYEDNNNTDSRLKCNKRFSSCD